MKFGKKILRNHRGQAIPVLGIASLAFFAIAAGGIDLGRHAYTANELQNATDIAALSAAKAGSDQQVAYQYAYAAAHKNKVNGEWATLKSSDVSLGHWNGSVFAAGVEPFNSVKVAADVTIVNIMAGVLGEKVSTIERSAVAALAPLGAATPPLPLALGESVFDGCVTGGCEMPIVTSFCGGTKNAGWTSFGSSSDGSNALQYLPTACGGGGQTTDQVTVEQSIGVSKKNSSETTQDTLLLALKCAVCILGMNDFLIPIIDDSGNGDSFDGSKEIQGFATLHVDSFVYPSGNLACWETPSMGSSNKIKGLNVTLKENTHVTGPASTNAKFFGTGWAGKVA